MRTIISNDEHRRRDRARKNPEMDRKQYLTRAAKRRAQARRLASQGFQTKDIARKLGISKRAVQLALRDGV